MPFDGTIYNHPASIIDRMLNILGPEGEHWTKEQFYDVETESYCLLGAMGKAIGFPDELWSTNLEEPDYPDAVIEAITDCLDPANINIPSFNDHDTTRFQDVRAVLTKARSALVRKYGQVVA